MAISEFEIFEHFKNITLHANKNIETKIPFNMFLEERKKNGINVIEAIQMSLARNFELNIYKNDRVVSFFISTYTDNK